MAEKKGSHHEPIQDSIYHDLFMAILGAAAILLLMGIPWLIEEPAANYPFYKGPTIFPMIILSVMFLSSLPSFYRLIAKLKSQQKWYFDGRGLPKLPAKVFILLIILFLMGFFYLGLETACFLFFLTGMYVIGYRIWWKLFLYSTVYTTFIVVLFKYLLDIYFSQPLIYRLWGG